MKKVTVYNLIQVLLFIFFPTFGFSQKRAQLARVPFPSKVQKTEAKEPTPIQPDVKTSGAEYEPGSKIGIWDVINCSNCGKKVLQIDSELPIPLYSGTTNVSFKKNTSVTYSQLWADKTSVATVVVEGTLSKNTIIKVTGSWNAGKTGLKFTWPYDINCKADTKIDFLVPNDAYAGGYLSHCTLACMHKLPVNGQANGFELPAGAQIDISLFITKENSFTEGSTNDDIHFAVTSFRPSNDITLYGKTLPKGTTIIFEPHIIEYMNAQGGYETLTKF